MSATCSKADQPQSAKFRRNADRLKCADIVEKLEV
jgi:hypothetical protein